MNPEDVAQFLEKYTYEYLLEEALDRVPQGIDIREGSIIYDALAPACYQLADFYMQLKMVAQDSFIQTAIGDYLDLKVSEFGIERFQATRAVRIGHFENENGDPFDVPIGMRFSTIETEAVFFRVTERVAQGVYYLRAEDEGTQGNSYHGQILPIDNLNGLARSIIDEVATPAQNQETDDELRERFFNFINQESFGGNFSDYVMEIAQIDGVGGQQIYPVWNGGGTVKVVIIDSELNIPSQTFLNQVKEHIDPSDFSGTGMGFAPIGHTVTVEAPELLSVDVHFDLDLETGYTLSQVLSDIINAVEEYFLSLRIAWSVFSDVNTYNISVFRSQIMASIINIQGVTNVENLTLNEEDADIHLQTESQVSQLPFAGDVVANDS